MDTKQADCMIELLKKILRELVEINRAVSKD